MYLVHLKTLLTEAVKQTFDSEFADPDFRRVHASIEFPMERQAYPGIWIDYSPIGPLQIVGIGHKEFTDPGSEGGARKVTRWRFQGEASFTVVALTSLERDRLHDEVIRVLAFGNEHSSTSEFRAYIEDNEFLAINIDFDEIVTRGFSSSMGTPWQSDEMIYEAEIAMECFGEFLSDSLSETLISFDSVKFIPIVEGDPDPTDDEGWIK